MKKQIVIVSAILLGSLALTSCEDPLLCKNGDGPLVEEIRILPDFESVKLKGSMDITLIESTEFKVLIEAQNNLMSDIETRVSGDELIIDMDHCFKSFEAIHVYVYAPVFKGVNLNGSGDIDAEGTITTTYMDLRISGSGNVDMDLVTDKVKIDVNGSGNVHLNGTATEQEIFVNGSGDVNNFDLWTSITAIDISGSGDCRIYVEDELSVKINGSGDIYYKGYPTITDLIVNGSGEVRDAN